MHDLKLVYEGRYRDFQEFDSRGQAHASRGRELGARADAQHEGPDLQSLRARRVRGEQEFDPGGEVVASTDPFYRNYASGVLAFELSERLGAEVSRQLQRGGFSRQAGRISSTTTPRGFGGTFVYELSPLTSLLGEYVRTVTPEPLERPAGGLGRGRVPRRSERRAHARAAGRDSRGLREPAIRPRDRSPGLQRIRRRRLAHAGLRGSGCAHRTRGDAEPTPPRSTRTVTTFPTTRGSSSSVPLRGTSG